MNTSIANFYKSYTSLGLAGLCLMIMLCSGDSRFYEPLEIKTQANDISIIKNKGQFDTEAEYRLRLKAAQMDFHQDHILTVLRDPAEAGRHAHAHSHGEGHELEHEISHYHGVVHRFLGARTAAIKPAGKKNYFHNYFYGSGPSDWYSQVPLYQSLTYQGLYEDIDLSYYESGGHLKWDFIISPGADPADIRIAIEHADEVSLKSGRLHILTSVNEMIEQRPVAYQLIDDVKVRVNCHYVLQDDVLSYAFPQGYDRNRELIIDPTLIFASYSGAPGDNWGTTATFDEEGNMYGGGFAFGGYPTTIGASQRTNAGGSTDMGISKISADGSSFVYSTFIGGRDAEAPHSMIVNSRGELVVFGTSGSTNYPITSGAYDRTYNGGNTESINGISYLNGSDMVITVLSADGSALVGSSYYGGSANDGLNTNFFVDLNYGDQFRGEVVLDQADNIYIASVTNSDDIDVLGGTDLVLNDGGNSESDGIYASFTPDVSGLRFAGYLGGRSADWCTSIKVTEAEGSTDLYVAGSTASSNFPADPTAINPSLRGEMDAFVSRISGTGAILNGSYFGTGGADFGYFVEIDQNGDIYILGQVGRTDYPRTAGVFFNANSTTFIHAMSPDLSTTRISTQVGNGQGLRGELVPTAFLVDNCDRVYVSGWGGSTNGDFAFQSYPISSDAFQRNTDGGDFYLIVLGPQMEDLEYGSYFGGDQSAEHVDGGTSRFDKQGIVYQAVCAGCGGNSDFPTTGGSVSPGNGATNCNLGVFKFDFELADININAIAEPSAAGCIPLEVEFLNFTSGAANFRWDFGDGTISTERNPTHTYTELGEFEVTLIARGNEDCVEPDTLELLVEVFPQLTDTVLSFRSCGALDTLISSTQSGSNVDYIWSTGATTESITVSETGIYWVSSDGNNGCAVRDSFLVEIVTDLSTNNVIDLCQGGDTLLASSFAVGGAAYLWNDGSTTSTITVNEAGLYHVSTFREGECTRFDTFRVVIVPPVPNIQLTELCEGDVIEIASSVADLGYDYQWDSGETSPEISITESGQFTVISTLPGECTVVDNFLVSFTDTFSTLTFTGLCLEQDTILSSSIDDPSARYLWNDGSTDRSIEITSGGTYVVYTEFQNCDFLDSFVVAQEELAVEFSTQNLSCDLEQGGEINITRLSGIEPLSYSLDGISFTEENPITNIPAGDYTLTVRDDIGCFITRSFTIDTPILADVTLGPDITISLSNSAVLQASLGIPLDQVDTINWSPETLGCSGDCLSQEVRPLVDTEYGIYVETVDGCPAEARIQVAVEFTEDIYVPNVFSPNGDGLNDLFYVYGKSSIVQQLNAFKVYDRWGNLMWSVDEFQPNDPTTAWNGQFKEEELNPAVFVWTVEVEYINGEVRTLSGDVTLVR